jgi:hypothetical protein
MLFLGVYITNDREVNGARLDFFILADKWFYPYRFSEQDVKKISNFLKILVVEKRSNLVRR